MQHAFSTCIYCMNLRFLRVFKACVCVSKVITLVWANISNFFENATVCSSGSGVPTVNTRWKRVWQRQWQFSNLPSFRDCRSRSGQDETLRESQLVRHFGSVGDSFNTSWLKIWKEKKKNWYVCLFLTMLTTIMFYSFIKIFLNLIK